MATQVAMGGEEAIDDGARLKEALEAGATEYELEAFIARNKHNLKPDTEAVLRRFTPQEQRHVMRRGDLPPDCCEPVLCKRLKESREMARQLSDIVAHQQQRAKKDAEAKAAPPKETAPAVFMAGVSTQHALAMAEVQPTESRFAPAVGSTAVPKTITEQGVKEGTVCGVGGVIEVTKKRFGCEPGTRMLVLSEKGNLWQCEGGVAIIKFQKEGWRWVLRADVEQQKQEQQQKEAQQEQAARRSQEELSPAEEIRMRAIRVLQERERVLAREFEAQQKKREEAAAAAKAEMAAMLAKKKAAEKEELEAKAKQAKEEKKKAKALAAKQAKAAKKAAKRAAKEAAKEAEEQEAAAAAKKKKKEKKAKAKKKEAKQAAREAKEKEAKAEKKKKKEKKEKAKEKADEEKPKEKKAKKEAKEKKAKS